MQNYQNITLDVNNRVEYKYINAKQGDHNSRFLNITLVENGNKIVPTGRSRATFRCLKPDGKICFNNSIINDDGSITVCLTQQILAVNGTVRADISLIEGSTVFSSATFFIQVESSPLSEKGALSSDEFLVLIEKMEEVDALSSKVMNAADKMEAAENGLNELNSQIESINQNVESVQSEIQTMKDDIINIDNTVSEIGSRNEELINYLGYAENDILGLCVDYENKQFSRLAGAAGRNAGADFDDTEIYGKIKRCDVSNSGEILAYYGDADYKFSGSNGQVMVYIPKFYYKVVPLKLEKNTETGTGYNIRKANYYISATPKTGFKLHPAFINENGEETDCFFYSAYEGCCYHTSSGTYYDDNAGAGETLNLENDLLCSISSTSVASRKPFSGLYHNLTRVNAEKLASNRGAGWHIETIKALSAIQMLAMIEIGALNAQAAIGYGVCQIPTVSTYNCSSLIGSTNNLGNLSGNAASTKNTSGGNAAVTYTDEKKVSVSYRGIENLWGNIKTMVEGITMKDDGTGNNHRIYIADDFNFKLNVTTGNYKSPDIILPETSGYINAFAYDEKYDWLFIPSETGGNSNLPVGDYLQLVSHTTVYKMLTHGASWGSNLFAGLFFTEFGYNSNDKSSIIGARLIYVPTAV